MPTSLYAIIVWKWVLGQWQPQAHLLTPANPLMRPTQQEVCSIASGQAGFGFTYVAVVELPLMLGAAPQVSKPACMAGPGGFSQAVPLWQRTFALSTSPAWQTS